MNANKSNRGTPVRDGWQERAGLVPEPPAPFSQTLDTQLEILKNRLLAAALEQTVNTSLIAPLRRAANEAAALAWLEPVPLLVFPALFEEKANAARRRVQKQALVHARSASYLEEAGQHSFMLVAA